MSKDIEKGQEGSDPAVMEIINYVREHNVSPAEMFASYRLAMGIGLNENEQRESLREEVYELASTMERAMDNGLPMNVLAEHVGIRHDLVHSLEIYSKLVTELDTDYKSKKVLESIIRDKRSGELSILEPGGKKELAKLKVNEGKLPLGQEMQEVLAALLTKELGKYKNQKIEIMFEAS